MKIDSTPFGSCTPSQIEGQELIIFNRGDSRLPLLGNEVRISKPSGSAMIAELYIDYRFPIVAICPNSNDLTNGASFRPSYPGLSEPLYRFDAVK